MRVKDLILSTKACLLIGKEKKAHIKLLKKQIDLINFYANYLNHSYEMKDYTKKQVLKIAKNEDFIRNNADIHIDA